MNITQNALINQIACAKNMNAATVRQVFRSAENIIFDYLSSAAPSEEVSIKLFSGIRLERKYIGEKTYSKGMFQNMDCPEHVNVKACMSKYYNSQVNQKLFHKSN